jgi:hypothetical protein
MRLSRASTGPGSESRGPASTPCATNGASTSGPTWAYERLTGHAATYAWGLYVRWEMRILGWLTSAAGLVGVVVFNGLAPLAWVLRADLRGRARDLLAIPDMGLEAAGALTSAASGWLGEASDGIIDIKAKADGLASAPVVDDAAATELATAVDTFVTGPYARLRSLYAGLRERALAVADTIRGIGRAVPVLAVAGVVADRFEEIDARMLEIDATMTGLAALGPAGLAEPGVAATVSERAATAEERIRAIGVTVAEIDTWLGTSRERVAAADRKSAILLTGGAAVGTGLCLFVAWLNVLLFQQGRRWSSRQG